MPQVKAVAIIGTTIRIDFEQIGNVDNGLPFTAWQKKTTAGRQTRKTSRHTSCNNPYDTMKKFTVHLSYHGTFTTEVLAADEEAALEAARDEAARLDPKDFILALEPIENGHDVEETSEPEASKKTMYQPEWYDDDGTEVFYNYLPEGLSSFHVFATRGSCAQWLRDHGYDPCDFAIIEYHEGDIEDPVFLDA